MNHRIQDILNGITKVRERINAKLILWSPVFGWDSYNVRKTLDKDGEIKDVDLKNIKSCADGTLEIAGRKILVYLRDRRQIYTDRGDYQKFHIADCKVLQDTRRDGRLNRFVISTKTDGNFWIRILQARGRRIDIMKNLQVCKFCLGRLGYNGYVNTNAFCPQNDAIFREFSIMDFFEQYKYKETDIVPPTYNNVIAPTNDYPDNWTEISSIRKEIKNNTCEECKIQYGQNLLNVHHINGLKYDNRTENLKVLCIGCHSEQGVDHAHIKNTDEYSQFRIGHGAMWRQQRIQRGYAVS
jgi:hypothetical protein